MRVFGLGVLAVTACYSPRLQAGAPCDPAIDNCPSGQVCVASGGGTHSCEPPGGKLDGGGPQDAPVDIPGSDAIDGSALVDTDHDGINDALDNCPTVANPGQENEDGDVFGDVCDPCPPIADNNPADGDGDGVADACDPHPATPGDKIVLFEGFHHGIPATWDHHGPWTADADSVTVDVTNDFATLTVANLATARETVSTAITVAARSTTDDASTGVVDAYDHGTGHGVYCHLTQWLPDRFPLIVTTLKSHDPHDQPFEMTNGQSYVVRQTRDAGQFTCNGTRGAAAQTTSQANAQLGQGTDLGLRIINAKATFSWVMVVQSP